MSRHIYFLITITGRDRLGDFMEIYKRNGVTVNQVALGHGTATNDMMGLLGLDSSEKAVGFAVVTGHAWHLVKQELQQKLYIDVPGTGVAFTIPLASIGGPRELAYLTEGQNYTKGEEKTLKNTEKEMLVIICNQGYSEDVMDAARTAGAAGGTVIHAKGTGTKQAEKFFGITLASEKDIIFIVTKTEMKTAIMEAIMKNAGIETKAKGIVFSLPVTDTAGLKLLDQLPEPDEEELEELAAAAAAAGEETPA